jgi:hypothetical protein
VAWWAKDEDGGGPSNEGGLSQWVRMALRGFGRACLQ